MPDARRAAYARRGTPHWDPFLDLLVPFNRSWAMGASALVILISNSLMRPPGSDKDVPSRVEAVYAVGRLGDSSSLPENLRDRERPSSRTPLTEFAFEGHFRA